MNDDSNKGTSSSAVAERPEADVEGEQKKLRYPRSIGFIISNEFCERFCYYGMRTILVLYLTRKLGYDDDVATIVYHVFTMLVYFMCTFGAIISDSWLGKFQTILYLSIVYVIGNIVISLGAVPPLNIPGEPMTILGLFLIALGSGGIKPCVAAFGGDQFVLPEQAKYMATFFSLFYFSINAGSLISTSITPILRQDVKCFGDDDCYSLAFGVPGVLMIISILIFFFGKFLYRMTPPAGNMVVLVAKCIGNAISTRWREYTFNKRDHWLDYADVKYGKQLVNETKILLNILVLYIPLPFFWALFDQQGSRWTFQATRMDGDIGFYKVIPDQMQVVNPFLILVFIPLYDAIIYPLIAKIGIRRPLQKLTIGGFLAGIAFIASGLVELQLEGTYPVLPEPGATQLRLFNTLPCEYSVTTTIPGYAPFSVKALEAHQTIIPNNGSNSYNLIMTPVGVADPMCPVLNATFVLKEEKAQSFFIRNGEFVEYEDDPSKASSGFPLLRVLANLDGEHQMKIVDVLDEHKKVRYQGPSTNTTIQEVVETTLEITIDDRAVGNVSVRLGEVSTYLLVDHAGVYEASVVEITGPNSMSMMWLLPQIIIMTFGEVMFSVTGLEFSYAQAPVTMKSVIQACWLLTVAFGNIIDVIIVGLKIFESQNAISTRWRESKFNKREHWLDYADVKYGKQLVNDTKILLNILVLYIPLPFFWALFDQQGSRWTFQATRMDGDIGFYNVKPDQMQVVNPLLILVFIPLYDVLFYPLLDKIGIRRPLQKLTAGGILAGVAFLCSAIVETQLEATYPILPQAGVSQLRIFNTLPCDYMVNTNNTFNPAFNIKSLDAYQDYIPVDGLQTYQFNFTPAAGIVHPMCQSYQATFILNETNAQSIFMRNQAFVEYSDSPAKASSGLPLLRMISNFAGDHNVKFVDPESEVNRVRFDGTSNNRTLHELPNTKIEILVDDKKIAEILPRLGQVLTLVLAEHDGLIKSSVVEITGANEMSMMWLLPQYIIMTLGEVMFSVTGLSFSYSQAPVSMKSVLQACWMLTVAFGNVIDVIIVGLKIFDSQANEFFLFAGLMFVDMLLFMYLAYNYKSLVDADLSDDVPIVPAVDESKKELSGIDNVAFTKDVPSAKND